MTSVYYKIFAVVLLFIGEGLAILAEMYAARTDFVGGHSLFQLLSKPLVVMIGAGVLLISAYMMGMQAYKDIWFITVVSVTSILIIEPVLAYLFFHQIPNKGEITGLLFGALGFVAVIAL